MRSRDTGTGRILEAMVLPALAGGGYAYSLQVHVGERLGRGAHFVDVVAEKDGRKLLISLKWQQVAGTAEQKVPFEAMCLIAALTSGAYAGAYIVLGGEGWKLRTFYTDGGLATYLKGAEHIQVVTLEGFVARANRGVL